MPTTKPKWSCPKCGATAHKKGKGPCMDGYSCSHRTCEGLICECEDSGEDPDHGRTVDSPCPEANCYHCGWGGTLPEKPEKPEKLTGWRATAWKAGWRPTGGAR